MDHHSTEIVRLRGVPINRGAGERAPYPDYTQVSVDLPRWRDFAFPTSHPHARDVGEPASHHGGRISCSPFFEGISGTRGRLVAPIDLWQSAARRCIPIPPTLPCEAASLSKPEVAL